MLHNYAVGFIKDFGQLNAFVSGAVFGREVSAHFVSCNSTVGISHGPQTVCEELQGTPSLSRWKVCDAVCEGKVCSATPSISRGVAVRENWKGPIGGCGRASQELCGSRAGRGPSQE